MKIILLTSFDLVGTVESFIEQSALTIKYEIWTFMSTSIDTCQSLSIGEIGTIIVQFTLLPRF